MPPASPPPQIVCSAFGLEPRDAQPLPGGRGLTWRFGATILRPADSEAESNFRADVLEHVEHHGRFRAPRPRRTDAGAWTVGGWEAWEWMPGRAAETRVHDIVAVGSAFHAAISHIPRPAFLAERDDAWARADRIAWQETSAPDDPTLTLLFAGYRPVASAAQLVHGDLLGNVLFADPDPPVLIDWSPYWRPPGVALATAVADAVCWHGTDPALVSELGRGVDEWGQMLLRALAFRISTLILLGAWDEAMRARHGAVCAVVLEMNR